MLSVAECPKAPQRKIVEMPSAMSALSVQQLKAISMLMIGTSITDAASALKVDRRTLQRWRKNPHFQAEFNRQRLEFQESAQLRLQGLTHRAIDVMGKALSDGNLRAAIELLKIVGISSAASKIDTETDPEQIIRRQAEKMAVEAYTAEPFAQVLPGNESVKALGRDIGKILRERYEVESALDELIE